MIYLAMIDNICNVARVDDHGPTCGGQKGPIICQSDDEIDHKIGANADDATSNSPLTRHMSHPVLSHFLPI